MYGYGQALDLVRAHLAVLATELFQFGLKRDPLDKLSDDLGILYQLFHVVQVEHCESVQLFVEKGSFQELLKHFFGKD